MDTTATHAHARRWRVLVWTALGVFAAFRLAELTRYSLWYDELFSITLAQEGWGELLRRAVADRTNPPLFYALLKVWMSVGGDSVAWMRLLPCALGILVAVPLVALARSWLADVTAAGVVVAVAAASPLAVFLSNELRGYSLLLLLSTASFAAFARLMDARAMPATAEPATAEPATATLRRRTLALAAANVALVYTHYFGWLVIAAELGAALLWNRRALRRITMVAVVTGVLFAPWVAAVQRGAQGVAAPLTNVDWIRAPMPADVPRFYDALVARVLTPGTAWCGAVILFGVLAALAVRLARPVPALQTSASTGHANLWRAAWFAFVPVAAAYAAGLVLQRSVFVPRYLIIVAPAWWVLIASAVAGRPAPHERTKGRTRIAAAFAVFTLAAGAAREHRGGEKIQWQHLIAAIAADAGPQPARVYTLEGFTAMPATYYAATLGTQLSVQPARDVAAIAPPAWILVRSQPGGAAAFLGAGLQIRGRTLTPIAADSIPSQVITAYRVGNP